MEIHDDNALVIYTDGSSKPNPRRGGYAFILVSTDDAGEEVTYEYFPPGLLGATNNENSLRSSADLKPSDIGGFPEQILQLPELGKPLRRPETCWGSAAFFREASDT